MGFDQYHEPPDELPAATRTFARLCASLTEEAEAIGWYEQRIAIETDPEALAVMRDAQGDEFKHSAMNLGRVSELQSAPASGVSGLKRRVLPLVELRADFELTRAELRDADRGAGDADLAPLDKAAHQIAVAENIAVFHGWPDATT